MHRRCGCAVAVSLSVLVSVFACTGSGALAAPVLTGAGLFVADASGGWGGLHLWNTEPDGFYWNLFLTENGDAASGAFVNGPTNAQIAPNVLLAPGTHAFGLLGAVPLPGSGYETGFAGLNLYFDGAGSPGISLVGPTGPSAGALSAVGGAVPGPVGDLVTGAGTLRYSDGQYDVEVTSFQWDTAPTTVIDRVGGFDAGPTGTSNLFGRFTLQVSAVPEPAFGLALIATAAGLARRRRT